MKPSQLIMFLKNTITHRLPVLITGEPGIGKTDCVYQAAKGTDLIVSHPVVSDPTDYKGLPFAISNGKSKKAEFLPFGELKALIDAKKPTIFFMDDLGQAPPSVQAAAMQLILARRINGHKVSDQVTFIAATNRKSDRAGVKGILEPVKSRFATIVRLDVDVDDWIRWAITEGLPTELIAFIKFRPNLLSAFRPTPDITNTPSPRTAHNVGKLMGMGIPREIEYEVVSGAAGEGFAAEFTGFLRIFRNLPDPDAILLSPSSGEVPTDPATLFALCGALSRKASETNFGRIAEYANRLPDEFNVMLIRDCVQITPEIQNTRAYIEWGAKHQDVLI